MAPAVAGGLVAQTTNDHAGEGYYGHVLEVGRGR